MSSHWFDGQLAIVVLMVIDGHGSFGPPTTDLYDCATGTSHIVVLLLDHVSHDFPTSPSEMSSIATIDFDLSMQF